MTIHKCEQCQKEFKRKAQLTKHLSRKLPCKRDDEKDHKCDSCGKCFTFDSNLSRHRRICRGPRLTTEQKMEDMSRQLKAAQDELVTLNIELSSLKNIGEKKAMTLAEAVKIISCCTIALEDVFKPSTYFGKPGDLLIPEEEVDGQLIIINSVNRTTCQKESPKATFRTSADSSCSIV